ncbi:hypothetical protein MTHERMOG20_00560 [Moorella thermoacetica]|nr:hypothetical protein MOTHE_c15580 [Moorella thermoacetica]AKX96989.1 hypothetical protein MOTHA_c16430 [Moorella thermoacetica]OIQ54464.1 hypothetical protein MORE_14330 [Moorella thermoacetica]OIQ58160.1 hypothetical protein MOCA_05850 [Moorella thermoacetica]QDA00819.1 hypothetical protein MothHH_01680 [Moorella thermoacetica]
MCPEAGEWLKEAEYDLETAEAMHKSRQVWLYCIHVPSSNRKRT